MTRPNIMIIENGYAEIVTGGGHEFETTYLNEGRYVRIDDGRQYPQLCAGARRLGNTLIYYTDEQLARDCNARLFKTRAGFIEARARIVQDPENEWRLSDPITGLVAR